MTVEPDLLGAPAGTPNTLTRTSSGVVRGVFDIVFSTLIIRAAGFGFSIVLRRLLGPEGTGIWNSFDIAIAYLSMLSMGVGFSAERLIPYYTGRGDRESITRLRDVVFTWTVIESLVVSILCLIYAGLFGLRHAPDVRFGLYWLPLLFTGHKILSLYLMVLRSTKNFRMFSVLNVLSSALDWTLVLWAFVGGLRGVFIGATVAVVVKLALYALTTKGEGTLRFRWRWDLSDVRLHLRYGLSYSAFKAAFTVVERFDSVLVGVLFGPVALGRYFLGYQITRLMLDTPLALSHVALPNLMEKYAVEDSGKQFSRDFMRYLRWDLYLIVPALLPLGYFGTEVLVRYALPLFAPGLPAIKLLISAMGIMAVRHLYYHVLTAHDQLRKLIFATAAELPAFLVLLFALREIIRDPLVVAAAASFIAYLLHLGLLNIAAHPYLDRGKGFHGLWISDVIVSLIWPFLLFAIDWLVSSATGFTIPQPWRAAICIALFYLIAAPICRLGIGSEAASVKALIHRKLGRTKNEETGTEL